MINLIDYQRPTSFDELWAAYEAADSPRLSAGCTDLIPQQQPGSPRKDTWLDIRQIPELSELKLDDESIRLGACLTHHKVATDDRIRQELPALAAACGAIGSRQIRVLGTLGGNAANCSPCADSFLALAALDAEVVLRSSEGSRTIPARSFPRGPGSCVLGTQELIEAFLVPRRQGRRSAFLKLGPRKAMAVAKVSVAASAHVDEGVLRDPRLVMGSVAPTVLRVEEAEKLLDGKSVTDELLDQIAEIVERAVKPIDDARSTADYRRTSSGVLAMRVIRELL